MVPTKIKLAAAWTALMLTYLLGDVLRIFSGDFTAGMLSDTEAGEGMYLLAAALMLLPILMVILSTVLKNTANRWTSTIMSAFFFVFNAVGLPIYPAIYDKFLLGVSLAINLVIIWFAWQLRKEEQ